jgi:hypothetical protein
MSARLLIAGGKSDPSISAILGAARRLGVETFDLWTDTAVITFDPLTAALWQDAHEVTSIAAAFLRADVFGAGRMSVTAVLRGWLACHPAIKRLNPMAFGRSASVNKLSALVAAHRHGLAIPRTMAGNDPRALAVFAAQAPAIYKPVEGGDYCRPLVAKVATESAAIIAQERLVGPEMRIYRVGGQLFGFHIRSDALDYRTDQTAVVSPTQVPEDIGLALIALTDEMGLDFCASDFKTCPRSGIWVYLETNAAPMIAAFGPELAETIVAHLTSPLV